MQINTSLVIKRWIITTRSFSGDTVLVFRNEIVTIIAESIEGDFEDKQKNETGGRLLSIRKHLAVASSDTRADCKSSSLSNCLNNFLL